MWGEFDRVWLGLRHMQPEPAKPEANFTGFSGQHTLPKPSQMRSTSPQSCLNLGNLAEIRPNSSEFGKCCLNVGRNQKCWPKARHNFCRIPAQVGRNSSSSPETEPKSAKFVSELAESELIRPKSIVCRRPARVGRNWVNLGQFRQIGLTSVNFATGLVESGPNLAGRRMDITLPWPMA